MTHWCIEVTHWCIEVTHWCIEVTHWCIEVTHWCIEVTHWCIEVTHWCIEVTHWCIEVTHWCIELTHFFIFQVLGKSLRLLFTTRDVSVVKSYVQSQCSKLLEGRANIQDYTLAREYRGMSNYRPGACVPALELSRCVCVCVLFFLAGIK